MTKHKLFISYYHNDDEKYRNKFEELFGDLFINKSVKLGDIDEDLSTEYIKRLIREKYISDTSVVVVLIGKHTYCRKHVDWEISAGLGNNTGLVGLILPTHNCYNKDMCLHKDLPDRLVENLKTDYALLYDWTENRNSMKNIIEKTFENKLKMQDKKVNPKKQMKNNRCS
jgi:hypothetical protein